MTDIHVHARMAPRQRRPECGYRDDDGHGLTFTGNPVHRDVAMTGEISSRSGPADRWSQREAPRGASRRHQNGADPRRERKGRADIPENVKNSLSIIPVSDINEVERAWCVCWR